MGFSLREELRVEVEAVSREDAYLKLGRVAGDWFGAIRFVMDDLDVVWLDEEFDGTPARFRVRGTYRRVSA